MKQSTGNPFSDSAVVSGYEAWYETTGRQADRLEKLLLRRLLACSPQADTILEVGCGTGHFTRWFGEQGVRAMGLDLSLPMLAEAGRLGSPFFMRGDALALPFSSGVFDLIALITTLEFVLDPNQALAEGLRVAQQGLILGVLNRQSLLGWRLKREGGPAWEAARLFTPAELSRREAGANRVEDDPMASVVERIAIAMGRFHWHGAGADLIEEGGRT
jgi:SAM-dependent methyltransferase